MKLESVVVKVGQGRRLRLHPEGGLDLEFWNELHGWCLDNDAHVNDADLAGLLRDAAALLTSAADDLAPDEDQPWTVADILAREG